ncbi:endolytic transglycosylase MltG [Balneolaceae bacterium YR4-1]|uniref:Endolytic murein transglycosylase n=1 Tax=Halalkalibaculum roseum TaxID=2709311 RepID=A0A6M1SWL0_9BACT|nr:endolytic transglycosylase MltG [Halalkalibaculum roseum]NGP76456.1 endolytic transglycosylase MltG [Halalkalibaculum roseum]
MLLVMVLIAGSRLMRLESGDAISAEKEYELYLNDSINLEELTAIFADSGIVQDTSELKWAARLLGWNRFSNGHYKIDGNYSYDSLLSKMARGIQDPVTVTLIPGSTEERLADRMINTFQFDSASFYKTLNDSVFIKELNIDRKDLLGRLFPDTYSLYWTTTPESVLKRILNEFQNSVIEPNKEAFSEIDKTVDEIVTLASIIEWEATRDEEKRKISGLYWNRLNRGMRLQADPTVNFVVNERRRLLYEDYEIDHPYNTYMNSGLPPGPITNPSLSSIEAALDPASHDYLYMVASPEGTHVFSETFEEHKRESAKWRKWIREQYREKRRREAEENSRNSR